MWTALHFGKVLGLRKKTYAGFVCGEKARIQMVVQFLVLRGDWNGLSKL